MTEAQSVVEVQERWRDCQQFYGTRHARIGRELAFTIDQQHYADDNDSDPQRIKPTDPAMLNMQRNKAAQILKAGAYYEMYPVDRADDPQTRAEAKGLMDQVFNDPECELADAVEDVVDGALACGIWGLHVGFDPDCGEHGELTYESLDPRTITWTPGFKNPASKRCPWLTIERKMLPAEVKRMKKRGWKNTEGVLPDSIARAAVPGTASGPIRTDNSASEATSQEKYVTVLFHYERFVPEMNTVTSYRRLDPGDYHMWCPDCGFRGMPQSVLDIQLPKRGEPCPDCGTTTVRAEAEAIDRSTLAYRKGQRLRIVNPIQGMEYFNDRWEYDSRGFCTLLYAPYNHPLDPIPHSDTFYYRSLTCVSDAMLRLGYEQMRKAHGIIVAPQDSLFDAYGEAFAFSEHRDVAYYDNDVLNPNAIQWFQPSGLNNQWVTYFQAIQGVFAANKGTGDIGLSPNQSKDIAVGTVQTLIETGNIPVDRHIRRFQRFMSLVRTRSYEILRSTLTTARATRVMGPDGVMAVWDIRAAGLPGYDIVTTSEPKITQMEQAQLGNLIQVAQAPPPIRKFLARYLNVSPTDLAQLEADERAYAEQQRQTQNPPPPQNPSPPANRLGDLFAAISGSPQTNGATA